MRFLSTLVASALGTLLALGLLATLLFFFIFAIALSGDDTPDVDNGSVLVMNLSGPIPETAADDPFAEAFFDAPSYDLRDVTRTLQMAASDERISGVWLQLKGVSAPWATLESVRAAMVDYKESGKPLIASSDDYGMSEAQYFLASAADSVFSAPQSAFVLNGFYTRTPFFKGSLDRLSIEPQIIRAGKYKAAVEPFLREDLSAENREQLQALLQTQQTQFFDAVAAGRGLPADRLEQMTQESGLITAEDGVQAGLLDGLLFHDEVEDAFKGRLGLADDEDLETLTLSDYRRVPPSSAGIEEGDDGTVAIVYAVGQIVSGESAEEFGGNGGTVGAETFNEAMRDARENEDVQAVVLRVNSPGGSAAASAAMLREARLTAQEKPVVVSMGDLAASGGYWIAMAADTLVAEPTTITGSIGVFGLLFNTRGFFNEELGVTFDGVETSPLADAFSGLAPLSDDERALIESSIDNTYDAFLEIVAENRGWTTAEVDSLAQGRVWSGADAREVGLVDTLGTLDDAVGIAARAAGLEPGSYRTRVYPRPETFFEQLNSALGARAEQAVLRWTTTPTERAFLEQRRMLDRLVREHGTVQARLPVDIVIE